MRCKYPEKDLAQRLDGTICRYDDFPYYVRYQARGTLHLYSLQSNGKKLALEVNPHDERLDISTVPLGFCQASENVVTYLSRRPNRLYKQGISSDSLSMRWIGSQKVNFTYICGAFENMVMDKYPDLNDTLKVLRKSEVEKEVAISRDTALKWNPSLKLTFVYYKGTSQEDEVGWIIPDTNIIVIPSSEKAWIVSKFLSYFSWEIR